MLWTKTWPGDRLFAVSGSQSLVLLCLVDSDVCFKHLLKAYLFFFVVAVLRNFLILYIRILCFVCFAVASTVILACFCETEPSVSQQRRPPTVDDIAKLEEHIPTRTIHVSFLRPVITVQCACEPRSDVSKKLFASRKLSRVSFICYDTKLQKFTMGIILCQLCS